MNIQNLQVWNFSEIVCKSMDKFYACVVVLIIHAENYIASSSSQYIVMKEDIHSLYYKFPNINLEIVAALKSWLVAMKLVISKSFLFSSSC